MAYSGQVSRSRDAFQSIIVRLYKFALVLTAHEDLARGLLRSTCKALNLRKDFSGDERDPLIEAFRRMYALWSAKLDGDPSIQKRCTPDARLFASFLRGPAAGQSSFAKFIANMPSHQRAALYLVYGEGSSYDEAAEVTGLDTLALMKLLARGHVALSRALDEREQSEAYLSDVSPGRERAA